MNINALNEDNLWFIKNVPVAGAKLINSLGEGCFFFFFSHLFLLSPVLCQLFRVGYLNQNQKLLTQMKTHTDSLYKMLISIVFFSQNKSKNRVKVMYNMLSFNCSSSAKSVSNLNTLKC